MIPESPICNVCEYSQDGVKCPPTAEQAARGLVPLSAVPSQLWNSLWHDANAAANCIKYASDALMVEINNVLAAANITACAQCTDQLAEAITCLLQTIDPNGGKSSVKSSSTPGMVSIDNNGFMTANCVGNANCLNTSCQVIVDAVNEINTTYGNAYSTLWQDAYDTEDAKADNDHASCDTDYGVGTASIYGHLKISDVCCEVLQDCGNVAASQKALADIWAYVSSTAGLGNSVNWITTINGSAGTADTASRSDHVHCMPRVNQVRCMAQSWSCICVYTCDKISANRLASLGLVNLAGCPIQDESNRACLLTCPQSAGINVCDSPSGRYRQYNRMWGCTTCWGCMSNYGYFSWQGPRCGKVCFICSGNANDYCDDLVPLVAGTIYMREDSWRCNNNQWTTCTTKTFCSCMIQIAHRCLPAICCVCLMKPATPPSLWGGGIYNTDLYICFTPTKYFLGHLVGPMPYMPF